MAKERKDTPSGANQFSVYAQRDTDSTQVDWGVIAKDLTTEVKRISEDRAKRRNDIEVSTQEAMKELSLVADLDNQSVNGFVIRGGNFSKNALQTQMELLRNGAIKPEEYQLFMQQQKDGYANLSLFAKNADDKYKAAMARLQNGEDGNQIASDLEIAFNKGTFDYTDLKNKQLISNPSTGEMLIVTLQDDGNGNMVIPDLKKNPEMYQSLATLNNRTAFQLDRRNTGLLTDKIVENLGTVITSKIQDRASIYVDGGGVISEEFFGQIWKELGTDSTYGEWIEDQVSTVTGQADDLSSMNAAQVLSNKGVKFSLKDEPGTIQYRTDGNGMPVVMLTPDQMEDARRTVQLQIESKLDKKTTQTQGFAGKESQIELENVRAKNKLKLQKEKEKNKPDKFKDTQISYMRRLDLLIDGDQASFDAAAKEISTEINNATDDPSKKIREWSRDDENITVLYQDGRTQTFSRQGKREDIRRSLYPSTTPAKFNGKTNNFDTALRSAGKGSDIIGEVRGTLSSRVAEKPFSVKPSQSKIGRVGDDKLPSLTGVDILRENIAYNKKKPNKPNLENYWGKDGWRKGTRKKETETAVSAVFAAYLPRKVLNESSIAIDENTGMLTVLYDDEPITITGVTDVELNSDVSLAKLNRMIQEAAVEVTKKENEKIEKRNNPKPEEDNLSPKPNGNVGGFITKKK